MDRLIEIKESLKDHFRQYEQYMQQALMSDSPYVSEIMEYVVQHKGKEIRPLLVFLFSGIHSGAEDFGRRTYIAAMLVEMTHMASLIHDDVVDDAAMRHGQPSVNSKWNSKISVLTGDYILARIFLAGMESGQFDVVTYVTESVSTLVEGEFIQNDSNVRRKMTRRKYLDIIFRKTATLLGVSCGAGAMAVGANETDTGIARQIGINLGMAFQIKDDILDYAPEGQTGKTYCADIREKKVTLPLLTILERSDDLERRLIMEKLDSVDEQPENIEHIRELVIKEGGIAIAEEVMHEYLDAARCMIAEYPPSEYKDRLEALCDFIGTRDK